MNEKKPNLKSLLRQLNAPYKRTEMQKEYDKAIENDKVVKAGTLESLGFAKYENAPIGNQIGAKTDEELLAIAHRVKEDDENYWKGERVENEQRRITPVNQEKELSD